LTSYFHLFDATDLASRAKNHIETSIKRIYRIWKLFGFASTSDYNLSRAIRLAHSVFDTYRGTKTVKGWLKTLKFLLLNFVRKWRGLDYEESADFPRPPVIGEFFPGRGKRFMEHLERTDKERFNMLLNTMLISIKGCLPRPSNIEREESILKWICDLFLGEKKEPNLALKAKVQNYVSELVGNKKVTPDEIYRAPHVPSTSANYIASRNDGGCVGHFLLQEKGGLLPKTTLSFDDVLVRPDVTGDDALMPYPCPAASCQTCAGKHAKLQASLRKSGETDKLCKLCRFPFRRGMPNMIYPPDESIKDDYEAYFRECVRYATVEEPNVVPVALSESLKVRMITKCPPYLMFVMNGFVDPLRKFLRGLPFFELTGSPIETDLMDRTFTDTCRLINSGDYTASTDELKSWVSEAIVETLCKTYYSDIVTEEPIFPELFERSLTGFKLRLGDVTKACYGNGKQYSSIGCNLDDSTGWGNETLDQKNGQLMGSTSSFPILCLANYALCKIAMEENPVGWDALLVNGDDCVFECSQDCYNRWCEVGLEMGLKPSPGKVWWERGYIQMNSRSFIPLSQEELRQYDESFRSEWKLNIEQKPVYRSGIPRWKRLPLILAGAAEGLKRSSSSDDGDVDLTALDFEGTRNWYAYEINNTPDDLFRSAMTYFDKRMMSRIMKAVDKLPTFVRKQLPFRLPRRFGGLGLIGEPSWHDLRKASSLLFSGKSLPALQEKMWLFWPLLTDELREKSLMHIVEDEHDKSFGNLLWMTYRVHGSKVWNTDGWEGLKEIEILKRRVKCLSRIKDTGPVLTKDELNASKALGFRVMNDSFWPKV
jgi:hypothetical protein